MKAIVTTALAGLFAFAVAGGALACSGHPGGHTADISKPITTAGQPITPKPGTDG